MKSRDLWSLIFTLPFLAYYFCVGILCIKQAGKSWGFRRPFLEREWYVRIIKGINGTKSEWFLLGVGVLHFLLGVILILFICWFVIHRLFFN